MSFYYVLILMWRLEMISRKGSYRKTIYTSKDGFTVGLFKVRYRYRNL